MSAPRILVVQCAASDPPARLGEWLGEAGAELAVVPAADAPRDPAGSDALLVLGGEMGANDDALFAWIPRVKDLLRAALTAETPTLGVCLGAQLLAVAAGGRVERRPEGVEVGAQLIAKRSAAATDPLFRALPITPDVIQWHYDTITALPPGAVHLASSPVNEHQAFRLGRLAWGIQFHIETTPQLVADWADDDAVLLDEMGIELDLPLVVDRAGAVHDDLAEVWRPFAAAFVDIARDPSAVAPPPRLRESTAAPVTDPAAIRAALAAEMTAARTVLPMPGRRGPEH
jgi:GMP synthase-like glutamine amidotransferase